MANSRVVSAQLDPDTLARLDELVDNLNTTRSQVVRVMLHQIMADAEKLRELQDEIDRQREAAQREIELMRQDIARREAAMARQS
jgi:antitoxin component of RelBE/YafQ-DinJ toxin-antitoxin module